LSSLPMYPYFIMHYIANSLLEEDKLAEEFMAMEKVQASRALAMRTSIDAGNLSQGCAHEIAADVPIHKLNTYRSYSQSEMRTLESLLN